MASMRDAMRRLNVIYEQCAPEAIAAASAEKSLDEFTRLKKKVHSSAKDCRQALKEREVLIQRNGTSSETAEASYHIRILIKDLKDNTARMTELVAKAEKVKGKKRLSDEEIGIRKEVLNLCQQHINECEELEKRRFLEKYGVDHTELMEGNSGGTGGPRRAYGSNTEPVEEKSSTRKALFEGASDKKKVEEDDPFTSKLPDIDVEADFKLMNEKNNVIDQDLEDIGQGVNRLKEIAEGMNRELDEQNDALRDLEKNVDHVLDEIDNMNIKLKRVVDTMMTGDRFMINCILLCIVLALVGFISSVFT